MKRWLGALLLLAATAQADEARRSGFDTMSPTTQAMQRDDSLNPAALWVADGEQRFGAECARCHAPDSMRGVALRYPAWDAASARPITLAQRITACRANHVDAKAGPADADALIALETYVARQSRGLPIEPAADPRLAPARERGRQLYFQRMGQLDFSCHDCHDRHPDGHLGGSPITQGMASGYPIYRLEWQGMGGIERRLRNCMSGMRAGTT